MNSEISRFFEQNPELLRVFADTFIARWDTYPHQLPDGSYTRAQSRNADGSALYYPLQLGHIEAHLRGYTTLGMYVMDKTSTTTKIVFDADDDERFADLHQLAGDLHEEGVPSYLERSRRGGHLWLFTPPMKGIEARRIGKFLLAQRSFQNIELYPKQNWVKREMVGSLVRLPFGKHLLTGLHYGFITRDGDNLAPRLRDQLAILAYPERVSQEYIDSILTQAPEAKPTFAIDRRRLRRYSPDMPPDEKIKAAMSPRDFVSQFVELDSSGRGLCPFHDDHKQSFKVYDDGWHCFAGCEGNTIIDFYIKLKGYPSLRLSPDEWKKVLTEMFQMLGF